jgi:ribonuclease P protein component
MSLTKSNRLKKTKDIENVFFKGKKHFAFPFKFVWVTTKKEDVDYRVCVSISKKYLKKAVDRNLAKRRAKEAFRKNFEKLNHFFKNNDLALDLMIIYVSKKVEPFDLIDKRVKKFIEDFEKYN